MQKAKYTKDGRNIDAENFPNWPEGAKASGNGELVCPGCGQPVIFRNGVPGARRSCFCAYPHTDGCSFATSNRENDTGNEQLIARSRALDDPDTTLVIKLPQSKHRSGGSAFSGSDASPDCDSNQISSGSAKYSFHALSSYLKSLIVSPDLLISSRDIRVPYEGTFKCSKFFVNGCELNYFISDTLLGFWGKIQSVNYDPASGLWMNLGDFNDLSILVPASDINHFVSWLCTGDLHSLVGVYILVLARLQISKLTGKPFVLMEDLDRIALAHGANA